MHHLRQMIKSSLKNCCTFLTDDYTLLKIWSVQQHAKENSVYILLQVRFVFFFFWFLGFGGFWGTLQGGFLLNHVLLSISVATVLHKLLNEFCSVRSP